MKQEQNNEITLGIDIGTQYCSAGYVLDNEYHQINFVNYPYGIPTVVCIDNQYNMFFGENALKQIHDNYNTGAIYTLAPGESIKTLLRDGIEYKKVEYKNNENKTIDDDKNQTWETVIEGFVDYVKNKCDISQFTIKGINVAYSAVTAGDNVNEQNNNYIYIVKNAVATKFGVDKKYVHMVPEYDLAASLFKDICKSYNNNKICRQNKICTIDVGAGTTDISCLVLEEDGKYKIATNKDGLALQASCRFGGKCIDEILNDEAKELWPKPTLRNQKAMGSLLHGNISPETFVTNKQWLINEKEGAAIIAAEKTKEEIRGFINEIYGKAIASFRDGVAFLVEQYCKAERLLGPRSFNSFCANLTNLLEQFCPNQDAATIQFILMGGSSRLPFVRTAVEQIARDNNKDKAATIKISYLNEMVANTPMHYINNSNFISRAAAGYECDVYTTNYALRYTEIEEEDKYDGYKISQVFFHRRKGRKKSEYKDGYKIISSKGIFNEDCYYYDNKADTMVDKNNNVCGFDLNGAVFEIKMPEIVAMEFALRGEDFCFIPGEPETVIKAARKLDESEFKCPPKQPMRNKNVNVGCVINGSNVGGEQLKIVVFDQEEQGCGPDKEEVGKKVFLQKALDTARVHGNKFPVELIEKYKLDKAKE